MNHEFPNIFKAAAKRKSTIAIPMILLFAIAIIIMVLSVQQSFAVTSGVLYNGSPLFQNWEEEVCGNVLLGFLSPFLFNLKIKSLDENNGLDVDFGLMGCPWRERNTIMRLCLVSLVIIMTLASFFVWVTGKGSNGWNIIYWIHWVLMLFMFVIFILDCDGLYSGYNSCLNEFNLDGNAFIDVTAIDGSGGEVNIDIVYDCKLEPNVHICLADIGAVIFGFCVWRISMFYKFGYVASTQDNRQRDIGNENIKKHQLPSSSTIDSPNNEMAEFLPDNNDNVTSPNANPFGEFGNAYDDDTPITAHQHEAGAINPFDEDSAVTKERLNPYDE